MRRPEVLSGIDPALLAAQPFSEEKVSASRIQSEPSDTESLHGLAI
jgi:hypothetical protein